MAHPVDGYIEDAKQLRSKAFAGWRAPAGLMPEKPVHPGPRRGQSGQGHQGRDAQGGQGGQGARPRGFASPFNMRGFPRGMGIRRPQGAGRPPTAPKPPAAEPPAAASAVAPKPKPPAAQNPATQSAAEYLQTHNADGSLSKAPPRKDKR